jgi:hypothetical protein
MELYEVSLVSVPANANARSLAWYIEKAMKGVIMEPVKEDQKEDTSKIDEITDEKADEIVAEMQDEFAFNVAELLNGSDLSPEDAIKQVFTLYKDELTKDEGNSLTEEDLVDTLVLSNETLEDILSKITPQPEVEKGNKMKQAISFLEESSNEINGEAKDQLTSALRSLKALQVRLYPEGTEEKSMTKEEDTKVAEKTEEKKKETEEEKTVELSKTQKGEEIVYDVGALKNLLIELQSLAKTVASSVELNKTLSDQVTATKGDIEKAVSTFTSAVEKLPLRVAQPPEEEKQEDRKTPKTPLELVKTEVGEDKFKTMHPSQKLHKLISTMQGARN